MKTKPLTKEEFLDKKNAKLIEEVKSVFELKEEIAFATMFLNSKRRENPSIFCNIKRVCFEGYKPKTYAVSILVQLVEMIDKGELIFKDVDDESNN